ncbi:hypothetical protein EDD29_0140 [Actinocorallia herbida]|uniref:Uncharacterized protein n=1 Tax=Actinocorallia herbida TaxID=58109 RepID=A0A3N1CMW8_9ACTN|nr:hypothetical protein [Actinocorallia herbida]ROO82659.1 hypothetical protein EDD29_0140 [Actinocorallia herbida]
MTPSDLRAVAALLREGGGPSVTLFTTTFDDGTQSNHIIAVCTGDHSGQYIDRWGCCQNCRFIGGYDQALTANVAGLLRAQPALADWLDEAADQIEQIHSKARSEIEARSRHAVAVATPLRTYQQLTASSEDPQITALRAENQRLRDELEKRAQQLVDAERRASSNGGNR